MVVKAVDELSSVELLDAVETLHQQKVRSEAEAFVLATHFAMLHNGDSLGPRRPLPGMERSVRLGGEGTPLTREFAAAELGARMQMSTVAARHYMADGLDTRHRLPKLWARMRALEVRVSYCRHVAQQTRSLSADAAARVDASVAECADGRIPWSRFEAKVAGAVVAADPEAAAAREEEERTRQFARTSRFSEHGMKGFFLRSTTGLIARFDATVAFYADMLRKLGDRDDEDLRRVKACLILANPLQAVELLQAFAGQRATAPAPSASAQPRGDGAQCRTGEDEDQETALFGLPDEGANPACREVDPDEIRESDIAPADNDADVRVAEEQGSGTPDDSVIRPRRFSPTDLVADPACTAFRAGATGHYTPDLAKLLPTVKLYLHVSRETVERGLDGVVRWEGEGPVTGAYLRDVLGLQHRFSLNPVIDCENMAPTDSYEIPDRHREAVHLRNPADVHPYAAQVSRKLDIDHTEEYVDPDEGGPPGQSNLGNYGPLGRFHHRLKTHGGWQLRQPFPGIYVARDPSGHYYLVDHTGTRKITCPGDIRVTGVLGDDPDPATKQPDDFRGRGDDFRGRAAG